MAVFKREKPSEQRDGIERHLHFHGKKGAAENAHRHNQSRPPRVFRFRKGERGQEYSDPHERREERLHDED